MWRHHFCHLAGERIQGDSKYPCVWGEPSLYLVQTMSVWTSTLVQTMLRKYEASWLCGSWWTWRQIRGQGLTLVLTDTDLLNSPEPYNHNDVRLAPVKASVWTGSREAIKAMGLIPMMGMMTVSTSQSHRQCHITEPRHMQDQGLAQIPYRCWKAS